MKARRQGRLHFLKNAAEYIAPFLFYHVVPVHDDNNTPTLLDHRSKAFESKALALIRITYQFVLSKDKYSLLIYLALGLVVQAAE